MVLMVIQRLLDDTAIREWGWRLMFLVGALLAFAVLLLRSYMHETVAIGANRPDAGSLAAGIAASVMKA